MWHPEPPEMKVELVIVAPLRFPADSRDSGDWRSQISIDSKEHPKCERQEECENVLDVRDVKVLFSEKTSSEMTPWK